MQNASFRQGLIVFLFVTAVSSAVSQPSHKLRAEGEHEHQAANTPREWPLSMPAIIAEQEPPEIGTHQRHKAECNSGGDDGAIALRSALAAEKQADHAQIGILVSIFAAAATAWAAIEAGRAAQAASKANDTARDIAHRELRAYVHVSQAKIANTNSEYGPTVSIEIKNWGQTPAYGVRHRFNYVIPLVGSSDFSRLLPCEPIADIAPGQTLWKAMLVPLSVWDRHKERIEKGMVVFYVFGEISYSDAFENRAVGNQRITAYRFKITCDEERVADGPLTLCDEGNEAT